MRRMTPPRLRALFTTVVLASLPARALAEEHSVIKDPGDHPRYVFEAEPHLTLGFAGPFDNSHTVGVGFRGTFHIADGFVKRINDSVGVGIGLDFAGDNRLLLPVVMQWNFWLSTHWSVFGEPGLAIQTAPAHDVILPILYVGGRYNFTDFIALTMRIGFPDVTVGVSFFL
ncbi:MAG TPA: hypothetical protein VKU41_02840 [Polyangiaceae bacterium]|nr:hypothetical protein [Polyangiaceae bacterium]